MKARAVRPALALFSAWTVLNLLLNVRYPALEPPALYLLPSLDATLLLAGIALLARSRYRLPPGIVVALAVAIVLARAFRVGDGVVWRYFNRPIDLGLDMPTAWEIVRLMRSTIGTPRLIVAVLLLGACAVGFGAFAAWSIRAAERAFSSSRRATPVCGNRAAGAGPVPAGSARPRAGAAPRSVWLQRRAEDLPGRQSPARPRPTIAGRKRSGCAPMLPACRLCPATSASSGVATCSSSSSSRTERRCSSTPRWCRSSPRSTAPSIPSSAARVSRSPRACSTRPPTPAGRSSPTRPS